MYVCMPDQKRAPDLIPDGCEEPWGWWELNSRPIEEQPVRLTTETSLSTLNMNLMGFFSFLFFFETRSHSAVLGWPSTQETCLLLPMLD